MVKTAWMNKNTDPETWKLTFHQSVTNKKSNLHAGEIAEWLGAHTTYAQGWGLIFSSQTPVTLSPGGPALLTFMDTCSHMHI